MKRTQVLLFVLFLCSLTGKLFAQIPLIFDDNFPDSAKTKIGIAVDAQLNSNSLSADFISKFYKGGYISNELKDGVLEQIKNKNRLGADLNTGVFAAFKLDSLFHRKDFSIFISIKDRQHFDCAFSADLYKVGLYGNAGFAGNTAYFDGFNLSLLRYQQFQIGLFSSKLDSAARWGVGISFLKGEQYASIYAKKASLYTSEDGQFIDFNTSMQVAQSDTSKKGLGAFNGYGASVDIFFEAPFKTKFGDSKLSVSVADIGLIHFNSQTLYLNQDSLFHFEGFAINSIYDLQDSTLSNTSQDSIINSIAPFKKRAISITIPATLNLNYQTQFSKHFTLSEGLHYVFNANYSLLVYAKADVKFNKLLQLSASFGYGGYGSYNIGLGAKANFPKGFQLYLGSSNLEGFIVPSKMAGQAAYISIVKNFY